MACCLCRGLPGDPQICVKVCGSASGKAHGPNRYQPGWGGHQRPSGLFRRFDFRAGHQVRISDPDKRGRWRNLGP
jgi:hypothetical protein